jgi:soluble lytic murein transglycosylase-like protein
MPAKPQSPATPVPSHGEILAELRRQAANFDVPFDFSRRQMFAESSFNPNAPTSKTGAVGLMQVEPKTAAGIDPDLNVHDWRQNVEAGIRYDRQLMDKYRGDLALAAAAYNAGPRNVLFEPPMNTWPYVWKLLPDWQPNRPGAGPSEPVNPLPPRALAPALPQRPGVIDRPSWQVDPALNPFLRSPPAVGLLGAPKPSGPLLQLDPNLQNK